MIRKLVLLLLLLAPAYAISAEDPNTPKTVTIPLTVYADILKHLANLANLENATPVMTLQKFQIVKDFDGRVYAQEKIKGTLEVGYLRYSFEVTLPVEIVVREKPKSFFTFRYKIGAYMDPSRGVSNLKAGGALLIEPFAVGILGVNGYLGSGSAGGAVSVGITKNLDAFAGCGVHFDDGSVAGIAGLSLSLN